MKITNTQELYNNHNLFKETKEKETKKIIVCAGTGCVAGGALDIYDEFERLLGEKNLDGKVDLVKEVEDISLKKSGCPGLCEAGPLVRIEPGDILYTMVKVEDCKDIIDETFGHDKPLERLLFNVDGEVYVSKHSIPFYINQSRIVLEDCGEIDPESIEEYIANGGYLALARVLDKMSPKDVCNEIVESKLRGRGGGGFSAGTKWSQVLSYESDMKYIICNGDEGDPGAFMDMCIMEGIPHSILEGMIIAAYATKAKEGYIYVRAEYPLAVKRLTKAIQQARQYGLLGKNILGTDLSFDIHINQGAGAFVCGEGSALIASIEGERGMPRVKAKRTVEEGLWKKPTVLNNVETFANVRYIIMNGAEWYRSHGTENSPGTKAFSVTGNVNNTGVVEVPMGTTLREMIFDTCGGIMDGKNFKAVQIGGPSGGCLTEEHLDMPLDFDSLTEVGAMIGSGGMVVMDQDTCIVEVARFFMNFTQNESCGKCVPCREGTKRMLEIMEKIVAGKANMRDLDLLEELAYTVTETSLCGLGKTAANPVLSTMKYFKNEYIEHIVDKKCHSKVCEALKTIIIIPELCKGCSKCARICPADAILGKVRETYTIDQDKCIKCGACIESCAFHAIEEV
ncbi:MAG: NADH-quinone oxidoreductase subunit NuoF [Tissierella sp.]|nr:NADH-quinone oxidoreductase subunit NuoF [Tissierella sp.]